MVRGAFSPSLQMMCPYRNMLGRVGQGFHAPRLLDLAILDVIGTVGLAWLLRRATMWSWPASLFTMFALGILCHRLFCVPTTVDRLLFS